jgi:hypothetical protein
VWPWVAAFAAAPFHSIYQEKLMNRIPFTLIARFMRSVAVCVDRSGSAHPGQEVFSTC